MDFFLPSKSRNWYESINKWSIFRSFSWSQCLLKFNHLFAFNNYKRFCSDKLIFKSKNIPCSSSVSSWKNYLHIIIIIMCIHLEQYTCKWLIYYHLLFIIIMCMQLLCHWIFINYYYYYMYYVHTPFTMSLKRYTCKFWIYPLL